MIIYLIDIGGCTYLIKRYFVVKLELDFVGSGLGHFFQTTMT